MVKNAKISRQRFLETNISLFLSVSDESLAYLLKKKRYNDIQKILQNIATSNKTEVDQIVWESFLIERCDKDCEKHEKKVATIKPHLLLISIIVLNWYLS